MPSLITRFALPALAALLVSGTLARGDTATSRANLAAAEEIWGSALHVPLAPPGPGEAAPVSQVDWPAQITSRLTKLARSRPAPPSIQRDIALERRLARVIGQASDKARVAVVVRDLETGEILFDRKGDLPLNPASNHKLLTAAAALELLGADYRFETRVAVLGDRLYLVGEGDPDLQVDDLYELAADVHRTTSLGNIRQIVIDDSAFSPRRFGPGYDAGGPGVSYMAPSGALALQFSVVEITVRPGRYGGPVHVATNPPCEYVRVVSDARTGRGAPLAVDSADQGGHTVVRVSGSLPAGHAPGVFRKRVADPGRYTASAFADILARLAGREAPPIAPGRVPPGATVVSVHRSAPLPEVLRPALKFSNNFTTEQVLRTLAWRYTGRPGDWKGGRLVLERFWSALGHEPRELVFENASGLSREGRITARALVDVLALTTRDGSGAATMLASLPIAGRDGTLRRRLVRTDGRVRAKTGTLGRAGALSGVVASRDGRHNLGFSILINGGLDARKCRRIQDRVVLALLDHVDRKS